jgi:hypothetical protein
VKAKLTEFQPNRRFTCGRVRRLAANDGIDVLGVRCDQCDAGVELVEAAQDEGSQGRVEARIDDLLTISDSLNRMQGRRARKIAMRHASIGEIIRDIPGLDAEHPMH